MVYVHCPTMKSAVRLTFYRHQFLFILRHKIELIIHHWIGIVPFKLWVLLSFIYYSTFPLLKCYFWSFFCRQCLHHFMCQMVFHRFCLIILESIETFTEVFTAFVNLQIFSSWRHTHDVNVDRYAIETEFTLRSYSIFYVAQVLPV